MKEIREKAYAKLNISLDVTNRREDGYHDMVMVMQTVSLCDELQLRFNDSGKVTASSNLRFIPSDERNLAVRAALRYLEAVGESGQGLHIDMRKNIPVGAGMAGGSADAAAVLRGMNALYNFRLDRKRLEELACAVGSDVAFCVAGGTALARGRGEILEDLPPLPDCFFAICKPEFSISTPELFRKLDETPLRRHPDTAGLVEAIDRGQLRQLCRRMYNVFEDALPRSAGEIAAIRGKLLDAGALGAIMTGTGSAVYGVFDRIETAETAFAFLNREYRECFLTRPVARLDVGRTGEPYGRIE